MTRIGWSFLACSFATACGCGRPVPPPPAALPAATVGAVPAPKLGTVPADTAPVETAGSREADEFAIAATEEAEETDPDVRVDLILDGIRFVIPASWRKVKPQTNIVEAEFELPRVEGDAHDGRLTLMFSGGDPQEVIANRTAEFLADPSHPPRVEPLRIGDVEGSWVDLRGEWKGPSFRPIEPRPDYRMLLVILPFTPHSSFYAKLTGPRQTIAAREDEFREFVESTKIIPPGYE